ncbi:MAG: hypothetical protein OES24_02085 [Acidimicrobiia bacterium]|nr:hypothetical protein [Acidimicrobiia bacterium]
MRTRKWFATAGVLALAVAACGTSTTTAPSTAPSTTVVTTTTLALSEPAVFPTDEWPLSTPEEQGMDSAMLADMIGRVASEPGIDSVMVVRNGHVVLDAVRYPFGGDDPTSSTRARRVLSPR